MGPGIIAANVGNTSAGIATYSIAGAKYGYSILWVLLPVLVGLVIVQEMCNRMGAVTGKGLSDLIRENFGVKTTFYIMGALFLGNLGNILAEFAGIAASMEIFGVSKYLSVPLSALSVWILIVKWDYKKVERIFLLACLVYIAYPVSGFLARPDWNAVLKETVIPSASLSVPYLLVVVGIIGTTIAPWMQFFQQSAVVEKGLTEKEYALSRIDVVAGGIFAVLVAFFIAVACGATLFTNNIRIENAVDAALALAPLAGKYASMLFAVGLLNAALLSISVIPLSAAFYVCEGMGWESGVNKTFSEAPQFFTLFTVLIVLGAGFILIPDLPLLQIMFLSQVMNGILLPFLLVFILLLVNKKSLMGSHTNGRVFNIVAWATVVTLILLTIVLTFSLVAEAGVGRRIVEALR